MKREPFPSHALLLPSLCAAPSWMEPWSHLPQPVPYSGWWGTADSSQTAGIGRNPNFFPPLPTPESCFPTMAPPRHMGGGCLRGRTGWGAAVAPSRAGAGGEPRGTHTTARKTQLLGVW